MRFEPIGEGFVSRRDPASVTAVAAGPRCALGPDGEILCTFMVQSRLAVNDFVPLLARSRDAGMTWEEPQPIWPELRDRYSLFCSISRARSGELFLYGIRIPMDGAMPDSDANCGFRGGAGTHVHYQRRAMGSLLCAVSELRPGSIGGPRADCLPPQR